MSVIELSKKGKPPKERKTRDEIMEIVVVIMLGLTALLMAWATWIGSLHGGNQATNYTKSNNLATEGNSLYIEAVQNYTQDLLTYNDIYMLLIDMAFAEEHGDAVEMEKLEYKLDQLMANNLTPEFEEALLWAFEQEDDYVSPFDMEGYVESYFTPANEALTESEELLVQGQQDNANGDAYGLVTVVYSVILFLLGINGTFESSKNKQVVLSVSCVVFAVITLYMLIGIPMPAGFSLASYLGN